MDIQLYHVINKQFKLKNHPFDILIKNFTQTIIFVPSTWRVKIIMFPDNSLTVYATDGFNEYLQAYKNMYDAVRLIYYLNLASKL